MGGLDLEGLFLGLSRVEAQPIGNFLLLALGLLVAAEWLQRHEQHPLTFRRWPAPFRWAAYFAISAVILFAGTFSTAQFIYFQF